MVQGHLVWLTCHRGSSQRASHPHSSLEKEGLQLRATASLTTVPAKASGTFNPLCKVLCTLQSLYFCSIGSMLVFCLGMDIPPTSNCSPKPLYSWIQTAQPQVTPVHTQHGGQSPSVVSHSRVSSGHGGPRACHLLHNPQHLLKPTRACRMRSGKTLLEGFTSGWALCCRFIRHY